MFAKLRRKIEDEGNIELPKSFQAPASLVNIKDGAKALSKTLSESCQSLPQEIFKSQKKSSETSSTPSFSRRQSLDDTADSSASSPTSGDTYVLSKKEKEWKDKFKKLEQENQKLRQMLHTHREKYAQNIESKEELDGFQNQELSKVKHLLLQSQNELKYYEELVVKKQDELDGANRSLAQLKISNNVNSNKLSKDEKHKLEEEITTLRQEAQKSERMLEEKEGSIQVLQDRISTLEKRLADSVLPDDDHILSLKAEREIMEKKLLEARLQLNEIKSTWSTKINLLEKQISNLTNKMAEDRAEYEQMLQELRTKVKTSNSTNNDLEKKIKEHSTMEEIYRSELKEERERIRNLEKQIKNLELRLTDQSFQHKKEIEAFQNKISEVESRQTEQLEKEIEVEKHISSQETIISHFKFEAKEKDKMCSNLTTQVQDLTKQLDISKDEVNRMVKDFQIKSSSIASLQAKVEQQKSLLDSIHSEKEELIVQNRQLSKQLDDLKKEGLKESTQLKSELDSAKSKVIELAACAEKNSKVKELEQKILDLVNQVEEKNKSLKLNQMRLNDMKKTLQKELRIHASSDEDVKGVNKPPPPEEDINFKYLKHVVFKFMTCPEYEALQLIKAISVLLHFTPEEEKSIKDTIVWRTSWFGARPTSTNATALS